MTINQHCSAGSPRNKASKVTQVISLLALGWVAMAFSCSVAAEENLLVPSSVDDKIAHTFVSENDARLDSQARFAESRANVALIRQIGDGNTNIINQNRHSQGGANWASIDQIGNFNEATINQEGSNNTGKIFQRGNRLEANINQSGNEYEIQVQQYGLEGKVDISQSGSGYQSIAVEQQAYSGSARAVTVETY